MKQIFNNIVKWFGNLGNLAAAIASIVALGGLILGGIKLHDKNVEKRVLETAARQTEDVRRMEKEKVQDSINLLVLTKLDTLIKATGKTKHVQEMIDRRVMMLDRSYTEFLKATKNIDVLVRYLESEKEILKKNENCLIEIPYEQKTYLIPSSLKYALHPINP